MLRRNIIGLALLGCMTLAAVAALVFAPGPEPAPPIAAVAETGRLPQSRPGVAIAESTTCASECQSQHDRCRVQTKGSPSCDGERQRCLEICLHKKRK